MSARPEIEEEAPGFDVQLFYGKDSLLGSPRKLMVPENRVPAITALSPLTSEKDFAFGFSFIADFSNPVHRALIDAAGTNAMFAVRTRMKPWMPNDMEHHSYVTAGIDGVDMSRSDMKVTIKATGKKQSSEWTVGTKA